MRQFKIGDKVRIISEYPGFIEGREPTVGKVGIIQDIDCDRSIKVYFKDINNFWFYCFSNIELVGNESETSPKYTYDDVIIDPNDPRVEIGAKYWVGKTPTEVLLNARAEAVTIILSYVDETLFAPFVASALDGEGFSCLIRKKEPTYEERQAEWIKMNGIKVGDKVKILKEFSSKDLICEFFPDIKDLVGTIGEIKEITDAGIQVYTENKSNWWYWPYDCLEKVEEPEKKYVPFDLNNEKDRAKLRGAWVRIKGSRRLEQQIVALAINTQLVFLPDVVSVETKELLEGYEFIDGTPCGKLVEDEE